VPGPRLLSQRISEGDGIAIVAQVDTAEAARLAEEQGAKAVAAARAVPGIREATSLPLLWLGSAAPTEADARALRPSDDDGDASLETVAEVRDAEELEEALARLDPGIFLLVGEVEDDEADPLDAVLELLPDVPAGKLAIARCAAATRDDVLALERAGVDAVLVPAGDVAALVGHAPVDV
jgi:hypothetical protein